MPITVEALGSGKPTITGPASGMTVVPLAGVLHVDSTDDVAVEALVADTNSLTAKKLSATYVRGGGASAAPTSPAEGAMWFDPADNPPPVAASAVTFSPTGLIVVTGTNVQTALAQVDAELAAKRNIVGARAYGLASRVMGSGGWEQVYMTGETFDTHAFHDTVTNPDRFTVPTGRAGKYSVVAAVSFAANATGTRHISIVKNGVTRTSLVSVLSVGAGYRSRVLTSDVLDLAVGDYIRVEGFQDSGVGLEVQDTTTGGSAGETFCAITYLGA